MKIDSLNPKIVNIPPLEFNQLVTKPLLIDVRFKAEYKTGHPPHAVNLSLPKIMMGMSLKWLLPQWFKALKKDQAIALICLSSHRSPLVSKKLVNNGFSHVYNIN
jgi:rhodanese-related sulfurtransferase